MLYGTRSCAPHALALWALVLTACGGAVQDKAGIAPPEAIPETVQLSGGSVTVGFVGGRIREVVRLEPYAIMKHPVTQSQYDECVAAGACKRVSEPACYTGGFGRFDMTSPGAPAICVGYENAVDYCSWIGGQLPNVAEWLYAVRGPQPQRYAWGNRLPTCDQHPLATQPVAGNGALLAQPSPCHSGAEKFLLRVGSGAGGLEPGRVGDALLTPAELVGADSRLPGAMCGEQAARCMVFGRSPGSIDAVAPVSPGFAHSFRCTVEDN